jgi:hypothetical protein
MSSINYSGKKSPLLNPVAWKTAKDAGMHPIHVTCLEDPADTESVDVSFIAYVHSTPSVGQSIVLEDKKICKIVEIMNKVVNDRENQIIMMVPNVYAILYKKGKAK